MLVQFLPLPYRAVIEGYDSEKSKIPKCNATGCGAGCGAEVNEVIRDFRE
jgi:hypothetical protein